MSEHPRQPIIGGRVEAVLNVVGRLLVLAGFVTAVFASVPIGLVVLAFGAVTFGAYLVKVNNRLGLSKTDWRVLRRWLGTAALYRSLVTIRDGHDGTVPPR